MCRNVLFPPVYAQGGELIDVGYSCPKVQKGETGDYSCPECGDLGLI